MTREEFQKLASPQGENEVKLVNLYDEYYPKVARYAYVRIGNRTEAEDIASEVFLKALDSLRNYQERGLPMQAWLFRIAHNLIVDYLRKNSQHQNVPLENVDLIEETDPAATAENNLEMLRVKEALRDLTEDQREVIRLRFFSGLTSQEVSAIMKKSDGAVREMQRAALEKLRRKLNGPAPGR